MEIVNLSLFFFVLLIVHIETLNTFSYINKIYMQKLLLIFLLFTVCLRYNIFSSLHTFLGLSIIAQIY